MKTKKNVGVILLRGRLDEVRLNKAAREIRQYRHNCDVILVIDSWGGDIVPALRFVKRLERAVRERNLSLKARIYNAGSAAFGIALVAQHREMDRDGAVSIHPGSIIIESNELFGKHQIPQRLIKPVRLWRDRHLRRLKEVAPKLPIKLATRLHATNRLTLTPLECKRYGIVEKLF